MEQLKLKEGFGVKTPTIDNVEQNCLSSKKF